MEIFTFLIFILTETEGTWIWCNQEEFDIIDIFRIGYLIVQNDVVARIADTDNTFIIVLINMEKLATSINTWL